MIDFASLLPSILMMVAPILIAALGGMISEKAGVVNIALEGLMGIGAFTAATVHVLLEPVLPGWSLLIGVTIFSFEAHPDRMAGQIVIFHLGLGQGGLFHRRPHHGF